MTTLGLWIFFAVIVGFGAIVGLIRGLSKATIRLITLVLAAAVTFVIAGPITNALAQNIIIEGQTLGEMMLEALRDADMLASMLDAAPLLQEAILVLPAFGLAIVVFPVVFLLLKFLTWILFLFVQKPLRKLIFRDNCDQEEAAMQPAGVRAGKRFAGMVVGILTGALIFGMLTAPLLGLFTILPEKKALDEALDLMAEQNILSEADVQSIKDAYAVTGSPLVNIYGKIGAASAGRAYLNSVSKIEADGYITSLSDELSYLLATVKAAMKSGLVNGILSPEDPAALFAFLADQAAVDALMQDLFQSKFLRATVPEMMAMAMQNVANSMQVPANKEAVYNNMMDAIAQAVKDADIDFAAIEAYEQAHSSRSGKGETSGSEQEVYEANIQKLVELTKRISSILNNSISGDNQAFTDSVADQIVSQVKTQAVENGDASLANFDAAGVQQAIANIDATNIDAENADKLLKQLADEEHFETDIATVETITEAIRETVKSALTDDSAAEQTANTLATLVSTLADAVSGAVGEDGQMDITKLDFEKLAEAVTTLQTSNLKDVGSSVLDLVASGNLGGNELVSNALGAMKEGYEKGEDIAGAIGSTGALIGLGAAMGGNEFEGVNQEAMVNSITSLINNLNEFTIGLLPSIFNADAIASMGIPAEYADAAFGVVETLLTELMNLKGAENYENEAGAILSIYNLATSGVENFTEADISKLVGYAKDSDAIFNTLMSVSQSNPFGMEIPDQDTRKELVQAIEDHYAQSGQTQRELDIFQAIATLLGLDEEVKLG
ncbi:MAG: CvpA family protein [Oscillospiraceae bacterium]|nr:CvpA family protein [Oscillospiraceae bacterium]